MEFLSRLDYYAIGRRYIIARAKKIDPAVVDIEGSDANVFVGAASFMAAKIAQQNAEAIRSLTLDADGEELDRVVIDRYQLPRRGAAAAVVEVRMSRPSAAVGAGAVPSGTKLTAIGGVEYITTTAAMFGLVQTDFATASARAIQSGFAFQVGANTINKIQDPSTLFDPSIQVNNDAPSAGGFDRETDPTYRNRARRFWAAARRGTLGAIEQGALSVEGIDSASASEPLNMRGDPARIVELTIADLAGVANSVLAARVRDALREWRAGGITVVIYTSQPQIVPLALHLQFIANVNTTLLAAQIQLAIQEFVNSLGANEPLLRADLMSVLARFRDSGLIPTNDTIVVPAGDVFPDQGRTLRARLGDVAIV